MTISYRTLFVILAIAAVWLFFRWLERSGGIKGEPPAWASTERLQRILAPYFRALLAGWIAVIAMQSMLGASLGFGEVESVVVKFLSFIFLPILAIFLTPLVVVFAWLLGQVRLPEGVAYILTGLLTGLTMQCQMALIGTENLAAAFGQTSFAFDLNGLLFALTQPAGGAVGGFVFWRAMGYPGLKRPGARAFDHAQDALDFSFDAGGANGPLQTRRVLHQDNKASFGKRRS